MNTVSDLREELRLLAESAPDPAALRTAVRASVDRRARHRRTASLIAVAAAVVLVAGAVGVTSAMLHGGTVRPANTPAVVDVPDVTLPAGTDLTRHDLAPVTTPVTATPPDGLTGQVWYSTPGRLRVAWFDPSRPPSTTSSGASAAPTVGYTVTDSKQDATTIYGPDGTTRATVDERPYSINGHDATLVTAPAGAMDATGVPAGERLVWQLGDGKWITVWAVGMPTDSSSPTGALVDFASSIREEVQTLHRTVGIGVTLPGLDADSSYNVAPAAGYLAGLVALCPQGVEPFGSGSSADGDTIPHDPMAPCLAATLVQGRSGLVPKPDTAVDVDGRTVFVDETHQRATAPLRDDVTAVISVPSEVHLAAADLAAVAASVRLSPDVTVLPLPDSAGGVDGSGTADSGSASAVATETPASSDAVNSSGVAESSSSSVAVSGTPPVASSVIPPDAAADGLVTADPDPFVIPFTMVPGEPANISWTVHDHTGRASVIFTDRTAAGTDEAATATVSYDRSGPASTPSGGQTITVGGYQVTMVPGAPTTLAWTLGDGTGITIRASDEATARALAAGIDERFTWETGPAPSRLPAGLTATEVRLATTGGVGDAPGSTAATTFCPTDADHSPAGSDQCLEVSSVTDPADVGAADDGYRDWQRVDASGITGYLSPDGRSVAEVLGDRVVTVAAGASVALTTDELLEILASVPTAQS